MSELLYTTRGSDYEIVSREQPRFLSRENEGDFLIDDIAASLAPWHISEGDIGTFIDKKITGVRVNDVDVLSIDIDHTPNGILDPITVAYLKASRTKAIMTEYFYPELVNNAGHRLAKMEESSEPQLRFAQNITPVLKDSGKPIAVADIANRPAYEITHLLSRYGPYAALLASAVLAAQTGTAELIGDIGLALDAPLATLMTSNSLQEMEGTGIFNPDKISRWDRLVPDWEQARRLIAAKGVEQLTTEYRPTGKPEERPQIVALIPRAHGKRMANILVNPHPFLDKAQAATYKLLGPRMDFSVRTFEWRESLQKLSESGYRFGRASVQQPPRGAFSNNIDSLAGWRRISNRRIKI